jgi:hypothetical protein
MVAKLTLTPTLPPNELHREIPENTLKEISIHVGIETDNDMQESFKHSEYPVGERTFCTQHHTEHTKYSRNSRYAVLPTEFTLNKERRQGKQHDASHEYNLESIERGKTLLYHL